MCVLQSYSFSTEHLLTWTCSRVDKFLSEHIFMWTCSHVNMFSRGHVLTWTCSLVYMFSRGHVLAWTCHVDICSSQIECVLVTSASHIRCFFLDKWLLRITDYDGLRIFFLYLKSVSFAIPERCVFCKTGTLCLLQYRNAVSYAIPESCFLQYRNIYYCIL